MRRLFVMVVGVSLLLAATPGWAHHGYAAEFDISKPIQLRGAVTLWELVNPHSWIHIDVKDNDGTVVNWMIEGGSPNNLYRLGFNKDSLPVGTEIIVEGFRTKDGTPRAVGRSVTFPDGRKLFLGLRASEASSEGK
jgi:hypothetical protein